LGDGCAPIRPPFGHSPSCLSKPGQHFFDGRIVVNIEAHSFERRVLFVTASPLKLKHVVQREPSVAVHLFKGNVAFIEKLDQRWPTDPE